MVNERKRWDSDSVLFVIGITALVVFGTLIGLGLFGEEVRQIFAEACWWASRLPP